MDRESAGGEKWQDLLRDIYDHHAILNTIGQVRPEWHVVKVRSLIAVSNILRTSPKAAPRPELWKLRTGFGVLLLLFFPGGAFSITSAAPLITTISMQGTLLQLSITSDPGTTNLIQASADLAPGSWVTVTNILVTQGQWTLTNATSGGSGQRFFRVLELNPVTNTLPPGMVVIPAGTFQMGDEFNEGFAWEVPVHSVYVSAVYIDKYEVTKGLWDLVVTWALTNGYSFDHPGSGKAATHPVQSINWYDMVKWCNARSEMSGRKPAYYNDSGLTDVYKVGRVAPFVNWSAGTGYRLPTEAEWEKASRGGVDGHRFPWSNVDTISHSQANYYSDSKYSYDVSPTRGFHPLFDDGVMPYTSPAGSFAPNGYGVYDTAGNVWEWCWDYTGAYTTDAQTDPHGPTAGDTRVGRGGNWNFYPEHCRNGYRYGNAPTYSATNIGFRCAMTVPN